MTRKELEERLRALEAQHQADIALMNAAHEARIRSLLSVWQTVAPPAPAPQLVAATLPEPSPAPPPPPAPPANPQPAPKPRRERYSVLEDLDEVFPNLPDVFDKHDIVRALGYEPARTTLFRALRLFEKQGLLEVETMSNGGTTSRYRKLDPEE